MPAGGGALYASAPLPRVGLYSLAPPPARGLCLAQTSTVTAAKLPGSSLRTVRFIGNVLHSHAEWEGNHGGVGHLRVPGRIAAIERPLGRVLLTEPP